MYSQFRYSKVSYWLLFVLFKEAYTIFSTLRLGYSHLNEHRFWHNFQDYFNPLCSCSLEIKDTSHYLLLFHHVLPHCVDLMNSVKSVCDNFESMPDNVKKNLLLFVDSRFDETKIKFFLKQL